MLRTYGTLDYDKTGRIWTVDVEPHVSRRFKQIFQGINPGKTSPFRIPDKADLANEFEWFFSRYPLLMDDSTRRSLKKMAKAHRTRTDECESILKGEWTPPEIVGFKDGEGPFPFQQKPAEICLRTGRLLLLDDVGLGKTISALNLMAQKGTLPAVVVVQPHLSDQWLEEYIEAFTHLRGHVISSTTPYELPEADIYIFRYSNITGWTDHFAQIGLKTVIFDEMQELRRGRESAKGQAAFVLAKLATYRMGLTATPVYNYGSEIYNIVSYLDPTALGTEDSFHTEWCIRSESGKHWLLKDPDAFGKYLQEIHLTLRRTESDPEVNKQMPPQNRIPVEVAWNADDVNEDQSLKKSLAMQVLHGSFRESGMAARELDMLMRQETGIAKARSVAAYVRILVEAGYPVLLAGWHREVYRIWQECLGDLNPVMYTGSETPKRKRAAKEAFISGESKLMIISLRSGAGLDGLQHICSDVVVGEMDWSPQVHKQLIGRVRRWGQLKQVTAHFLHVNGGSDPVLIELLGLKASQGRGITDPYTEGEVVDFDESRMRILARRIIGEAEAPEQVAA